MSRPLSPLVSRVTVPTVQLSKTDDSDYKKVLKGSSLEVNASPLSTTIRLYIHSDCTDTHIERQRLWKDVLPILRSHAKSLGLHLHVIDPYHMIDCLDNQTLPFVFENKEVYQLNMKEISTCQELSAGVSFMTLLGQKYGHRSLQLQIDAEEFELLVSGIEDHSSKLLLKEYYRLDRSTIPLQYTLKKPINIMQNTEEWTKIHDNLSKSIWKGAKVTFGKDPIRVQNYIISATENEIIQGIFNCPNNINASCVWFKRTFTDLFDQRPSTDQSLLYYSDQTISKRGVVEFDSESVKLLNYLKEARMPAKYTGLDPANIFDFPIKWHKNKGLTPDNNDEHNCYLTQFCDKVTEYMKLSLNAISKKIKSEADCNSIHQECLLHLKHCKQLLLVGIKERPVIVEEAIVYLNNPSMYSTPLVISGMAGNGKSTVMAAIIRKIIERKEDKCCIMRFIGATPSSCNIRSLIKSICEQLRLVYDCIDTIPGDYQSILKTLKHLLSSCPSSDKPLYIFLDGIDLLDKDNEALGLSWVPIKLPSHVRLILSTSSEVEYRCFSLLKSILKNENSIINLPVLTLDQAESFMQCFLEQYELKITPIHMFILSDSFKKSNSVSLLYLKMIAIITKINNSQLNNDLIDLNAAVNMLLTHIENTHGSHFVSSTLRIITASYYGMSEDELLDILTINHEALTEIQFKYERDFPLLSSPIQQVPTIAWSSLLYDVYPSLLCFRMAEGGAWVLQWRNRRLHEIAASRYLQTDSQQKIASETIVDYFSGKMATTLVTKVNQPTSSVINGTLSEQPPPESQSPTCNNENESGAIRIINSQELVTGDNIHNIRRMTELPTALFNSKQHDALVKMVFDYHSLKAYVNTGLIDQMLKNIAFLYNPINIRGSYHDSLLINEARMLHAGVLLMVNNLIKNPSQLSVELTGRLLPFGISRTHESNINSLLRQTIKSDLTNLTPVHAYSNLPQEDHLLTMSGHLGPVTAIDSVVVVRKTESEKITEEMIIISSSEDCTLRTWDWQGSGSLKTFDGHTDSVLCVALSKNGQYAVSGGNDLTARYWRASDAECINVLTGHKKAVTAVIITKLCDKVISGSLDATVRVWNTNQSSSCKGQLVFTLTPSRIIAPASSRVPVHSLCLCKDDSELLSGLGNGCIVISNIVAGEILKYFEISPTIGKPVISIAIAQVKEGRAIISVSDGCTHLNHYDTGKHTDSIPYHIPLYGKLATTNIASVITRLQELLENNSSITALNFADLGTIAIMGTIKGTITAWDLTRAIQQSPQILPHTDSINNIAYSPCGEYMIASSNNGSTPAISVWKADDLMQPVSIIEGLSSHVTCLRFYGNSNRILSGHMDGIVRLWNMGTMTVENQYLDGDLSFEGSNSAVTSFAISNDQKVLMVGLHNGNVIGINMTKNHTHKVLDKRHHASIVSVMFTPTTPNKYLITADKKGAIIVRNYKTLDIIKLDNNEKGAELSCMCVGQDSTHSMLLGLAYRNGIIEISSLPKLEQVSVLEYHYGYATSINYYNDKLITTVKCDDGSGCVQVWDKKACLDKVACDAGITSVAMTTINGHGIMAYGCENGYIGMFLYNPLDNCNKHVLLGVLSQQQSVRQITPEQRRPNSLSENSKSRISQTTLQSLKEQEEDEPLAEENVKQVIEQIETIKLTKPATELTDHEPVTISSEGTSSREEQKEDKQSSCNIL